MSPFNDKSWPSHTAIEHALRSSDGKGVKIALLDTGVETSHPGLAGIALIDDLIADDLGQFVEFTPGKGADVFGHGTAIASVLRRHAPAMQLGSFRVLSPGLRSRHVVISAAVMRAIDLGYQIINCSWGSRDDRGLHAMIYKEWMDRAYLNRVHVVAACNTDDFTIQEWPGFFNSCITVNVAATDSQPLVYRRDHLVEFSAPCSADPVPWLNGSYRTVCSSSFAAPVVTAYLARLLSAFPDLSCAHAKAILQHHAEVWRDAGAEQHRPEVKRIALCARFVMMGAMSHTYSPKPLDTTHIRLSPSLDGLGEQLAEQIHDVWSEGRIAEGWSFGPKRDDALKTNPCLVPYAELSDSEKEYDRRTAKQAVKVIVALGYRILEPEVAKF